MSRLGTLAGAGVLLALAGCGSDDAAAPEAGDPPSLDAYAAVVADHLGREPRIVEPWDVMSRELEVDAGGATLVVGRTDSLDVAVAPTTDSPLVCADESFFDACVELGEDPSGGRLLLGWQEEEPEEDPGVVYVIDRRDGEDVVARYTGAVVSGDPRELDLGISLDEMVAVVTDERLTLG